MKKILMIISALVLLCSIAMTAALADGDSWYCDVCNAERTTRYCPICGKERPIPIPPATVQNSWICFKCGQEWPAEYNYCPDDHQEKILTSGNWPGWNLVGIGTQFKRLESESKRNQSYLGPNGSYGKGGGYKTWYDGTKIKAFFKEGSYVYVDLSYPTVGRRCLYFLATVLTSSNVDEVKLRAYSAKTASSVVPLYGPGMEYDKVTNDRKKDIELSQGTEVKAFFESDGWVFAEFPCELGTIRAWIPADQLK